MAIRGNIVVNWNTGAGENRKKDVERALCRRSEFEEGLYGVVSFGGCFCKKSVIFGEMPC